MQQQQQKQQQQQQQQPIFTSNLQQKYFTINIITSKILPGSNPRVGHYYLFLETFNLIRMYNVYNSSILTEI